MTKKILCVLKTTSYEHYEGGGEVFEHFEERRKLLLERTHKKQKDFEKKFKELAAQLKFNIAYIADKDMYQYKSSDFDLIMTFGGDGTFLNAAQHFTKATLMGINSMGGVSPKISSIGALLSANENTIASVLNKLKKGEFTIEKWNRLYARINGKKLKDLAVNDIYFGTLEAYKTTNFELYWDGKIESFRGSSGIVFSTGMGSTSWFRNAGGAPFSNDLPIFGFVVRDAQQNRHPNFTKGIVDGSEELILKPLRAGYILSFDSKDHLLELNETDELRIGLSKKSHVKVMRFT